MNPKLKEKKTQDANGDKPQNNGNGTFWTVCPYCYFMYEYDGVYEECCLRCQNCRRAFQGVVVAAPPVMVEGKEQYYCGIGYFPLKYNLESFLGYKKGESGDGGGGDSFLGEKKENNEGFKADCENMVVISDDSDGDFGNNEKGKDKYGKNSGGGLEEDVKRNGIGSVHGNLRDGETGSLMQGSVKTEIKDDGKKVTRKVKSGALKTKKLMGRGKKQLKLGASGNLGIPRADMDGEIGERTEESEDKKGSGEGAFDSEIDLEFFLGEDDVYVSLKNAA